MEFLGQRPWLLSANAEHGRLILGELPVDSAIRPAVVILSSGRSGRWSHHTSPITWSRKGERNASGLWST